MSLALMLRLYQNQREQAHLQQQSALLIERQTEQRRFIAMLSHEFRNPLASIDRAANLLQLKLTNLNKSDSARLGGIRSSVRRLDSLVDSFLVSEAVEQHRLSPVPTRQGVAPMLAQVIEALGVEVQGRLRLAVTPLNLQFALDARLIGIAVGNLLGNALRYSGDTATVSLTAELEGNALRLTVTDQGPGLSEDELAQLGIAYYRANSSLGKQGTGLGYFFSRAIVEAHGGTLEAANQPDGGLRVTLRLPGAAD
jgi:signal transduction histidine kinase